jgi:hypothetical protein
LHVLVLEVFKKVLVKSASILHRRALQWSKSNSIGNGRKIDGRIGCPKLVVHSGDGYASRAGKNVGAVWRGSTVMVDGEYRVKKIESPGRQVKCKVSLHR